MPAAVRRELLEATAVPGSTLRPIARFVVERDGVERASVVLGRAEIFEHAPVELALARLVGRDDERSAAEQVVSAAVAAAPGPAVYLPVNAETGSDPLLRREVAEACGLQLFQEKEAFVQVVVGRPLPEPVGLRLAAMSEIGAGPFLELIARCLSATVDRVDSLLVARHGAAQRAAALLADRVSGPDAGSWLYAETGDGVPVGFVGLDGRPDEPGVATLVLIGVLPEQRGRRHVDQLLAAACRAAGSRRFTSVLSLVDVENRPMMAAMRRSGADPHARAWHKWLYASAVPDRARRP